MDNVGLSIQMAQLENEPYGSRFNQPESSRLVKIDRHDMRGGGNYGPGSGP